jgi:hypothetical protein
MTTRVWIVTALASVGGIGYFAWRELRPVDRSVFQCNKEASPDQRRCLRGVCFGEGVGYKCFERPDAWCPDGRDDVDRWCYPTHDACEHGRGTQARDNDERPGHWQVGGPCQLTRADELP